MAFTTEGTATRETASLIGSDKVEGTPVYRSNGERVGQIEYRLIVACMLSGASRDRPVIVGWSTAIRGQVINESLGQRPKKLAAGPRLLARTKSSRSLCERRSLPVDPDAAKSAPAVDESAMVHLPVLGGLASGHSPWSSGRQASSAGMVASCL